MDRDLFLTDEDINGKEPTWIETELVHEKEQMGFAKNLIEDIKDLVDTEIDNNIRKTKFIQAPSTVRLYREQLQFLRKMESRIKEYYKMKGGR